MFLDLLARALTDAVTHTEPRAKMAGKISARSPRRLRPRG
jgi:hypothetical protein